MLSTADGPVTIRRSGDDDASQLRRLAELDSARVPSGVMLVAEVDGDLRAAVALDAGTVIADPFQHTRHLVSLLEATRREQTALARHTAPRRHSPFTARIGQLLHVRSHAHPA